MKAVILRHLTASPEEYCAPVAAFMAACHLTVCPTPPINVILKE